MVSVVKSEWHQVEKRYGIKIDADMLTEIYPDKEEEEIEVILKGLEDGTYDIEDVINEAWDNDVEIEWDYLNEDDWWTDRKGGYEVTYKAENWEVHQDYVAPITHKCTKCKWTGTQYDAAWSWQDKDGNEIDEPIKLCPMCDSQVELTEIGVAEEAKDAANKAKWATTGEEDDDENKVTPPSDKDAETEKSDVLPNYPAGEYTIRVWGRTREIGVGKISKQQYDYWSHEDHENDLSDAMNESYDYEENNTPKKAQFDSAYYEYQGVHSFWGFDEGDTHMTITNESGEEIYDGTLDGFINEAHGDNDTIYDATEEVEELYPEYLGKGYFVMWTQGGKGSCIQTTIDTAGEEFDPRKLKYTTWDVQGSSIVNRLIYNGGELDDYGMDSEHDNWRGQWSQFDVYHNKK